MRSGYDGDGFSATSASICGPAGIAIDSIGNIYFSDSCNNRVRMINENGIIYTYAGTGTAAYGGDNGNPISADLYSPSGLCIDTSGTNYYTYSRYTMFDNFYFLFL